MPLTPAGFIQLGVVADQSGEISAMRRAAGPAWARDIENTPTRAY
jgi:hypothetical protein